MRTAPASDRAPLAPPRPADVVALAWRYLGVPALTRDSAGRYVVSPSARRTMNDSALAAGELVTLDDIAAASGLARADLLAAVLSGDLEPAPSDDRRRLFFATFEALRFVSVHATGEVDRNG